MIRGPMKSSRPVGLTYVEKAQAAYGDPLPDWLQELAQLADREGLAGAEKAVGYSRSAISNVLNGKYGGSGKGGDLDRVAEMVRGALMAVTVICPVLDEIGRDRCLTEQKEPFRATSRHRAQLYHACKICQNRRPS